METPSDRVFWACVVWQSTITSDGDMVVHLHSQEEAALACNISDGIEELEVID